MTDTFDLRADIAEIPYQGDGDDNKAYFTMNFKLLDEVRTLRREHANADPALDDLAGLERRLEAKEADLKASTYTVEMMAVPRRRREDIYEEALDKFPAKVSFIPNQVDPKIEFQRGNYARVQVVAAGVMRIVNPQGAVQEENLTETVQYLHDEAPDAIFEILEKKGAELNALGDAQEDLHKSADF
jgi:hypothetical protein